MSNLITERTVANAKDNGIENITLITGHATEELENILENLKKYENVCVLMYALFNFEDNQDGILIRKNENVKKVLILSRFPELCQVRKLVAVCQKKAEWKEPFVITRVVPVDMSPYDSDVKMVFLLVRQSLVSNEIQANNNYSDAKVTEFINVTKKKVNAVCSTARKRTKGNKIQETPPSRHDARRPWRPLLETPVRFQSRVNPNLRHNKYSGSFSNIPYSAQNCISGYNAPPSKVQNPVETAVALNVRLLGEVCPSAKTNLQDLVDHNVRPGQTACEERALSNRDPYGPRRSQDVRGRAPVRERRFEDRLPDCKFARQGFVVRVAARQMPRRQGVQDVEYNRWGGNDNYRDFDGAGTAEIIPDQDAYGSQKRNFDSRESNPYTQRNNYSQDDDLSICRAPIQDTRMRGQSIDQGSGGSRLTSELDMGNGGRALDSQYDTGGEFERQHVQWSGGQRTLGAVSWDSNYY